MPSASMVSRRGLVDAADGDDPSVAYADVSGYSRRTRAIDDGGMW